MRPSTWLQYIHWLSPQVCTGTPHHHWVLRQMSGTNSTLGRVVLKRRHFFFHQKNAGPVEKNWGFWNWMASQWPQRSGVLPESLDDVWEPVDVKEWNWHAIGNIQESTDRTNEGRRKVRELTIILTNGYSNGNGHMLSQHFQTKDKVELDHLVHKFYLEALHWSWNFSLTNNNHYIFFHPNLKVPTMYPHIPCRLHLFLSYIASCSVSCSQWLWDELYWEM